MWPGCQTHNYFTMMLVIMNKGLWEFVSCSPGFTLDRFMSNGFDANSNRPWNIVHCMACCTPSRVFIHSKPPWPLRPSSYSVKVSNFPPMRDPEWEETLTMGHRDWNARSPTLGIIPAGHNYNGAGWEIHNLHFNSNMPSTSTTKYPLSREFRQWNTPHNIFSPT